MYSLFLRRHQQRSKTTSSPAGINDDTSVSLSSWACLDTSNHGGSYRLHSSDSAIHYSHTNHHNPSMTIQPKRKDDASINVSVSSWGAIDTDHTQKSTGQCWSDTSPTKSPIKHPPTESVRATERPFLARTAQATKEVSHSRDSSWGQMDLDFLANIAEHREKVAKDIIQQRQDGKRKVSSSTSATSSPDSCLPLAGQKSRGKKLQIRGKGRPPLTGRKMLSERV